MRYTTPVLTAAALLALAASTSGQPAAMPTPQSIQSVKHYHFTKTVSADVNYLLFLPKGYDAQAQKRWPMILFLHGAGERGTDIWKVATHGR